MILTTIADSAARHLITTVMYMNPDTGEIVDIQPAAGGLAVIAKRCVAHQRRNLLRPHPGQRYRLAGDGPGGAHPAPDRRGGYPAADGRLALPPAPRRPWYGSRSPQNGPDRGRGASQSRRDPATHGHPARRGSRRRGARGVLDRRGVRGAGARGLVGHPVAAGREAGRRPRLPARARRAPGAVDAAAPAAPAARGAGAIPPVEGGAPAPRRPSSRLCI